MRLPSQPWSWTQEAAVLLCVLSRLRKALLCLLPGSWWLLVLGPRPCLPLRASVKTQARWAAAHLPRHELPSLTVSALTLLLAGLLCVVLRLVQNAALPTGAGRAVVTASGTLSCPVVKSLSGQALGPAG